MFDAIHIPEVQEQAEKFLRSLSHHIFTLEARRSFAKDNGLRRFPSHLFGLYLDALPHALARPDEKQAGKAKEVVASIIYELVNIGHTNGLKPTDLLPTLHQIAARFSALCFEDSWVRKSAGCTGIKIMTNTPEIGERWTSAREIDVVRTLLHVLKDVPHDPPKNVQDIIDTLTHILRVTHKVEPLPDGPPEPTRQQKVPFLASIFFQELSSVHPVVRQASRTCIELLAELNDMRIYDLLKPHRDRVLSPIFTKPLRALPPPIMIGHVEIIRYCVSLTPPLCDLTDELLRLLHEALALADMDDAVLAQRPNVRAAAIEAVHLRVACIKLLTASMPMTDFFSKQNQTRPR
jgi:transformation/transcription domain-associated protein